MKKLSDNALKHVKEVFASNPGIDAFHVTTDGLCFEEESEAVNHGFSLTHGLVDEGGILRRMTDPEKLAIKEVVTVNRADVEKPSTVQVMITQEHIDAGLAEAEKLNTEIELSKEDAKAMSKALGEFKKAAEKAAKAAEKAAKAEAEKK